MKSIVEQYARGEFDVERPIVDISIDKLELNIESGTRYAGEFTVRSTNDCKVKLMVFDSRYLINFDSHTFIGKKIKVAFSFDASGYDRGKTFKGHINIVTDGGEFKIPYSIEIVSPFLQLGDRKIEDLFQFASLAEENWASAIRLFQSEAFSRAFLKDDNNAKRVYDNLNYSLSINQAMEEFLVYTHKKRAMTLSTNQKEIVVEMPEELVRATISINKNTWGYTHTRVSSDQDFLIPEKKHISGQDFSGNNYDLDFLIDPARIPDGVKAGHICIENAYQNIDVKITIKKPVKARPKIKDRHENFVFKKNQETIISAYIDFRTDKISLSQYTIKTATALKMLLKYRPDDGIYRLGLLHMHLLDGDTQLVEQEFTRIDADVDDEMVGDLQQCYYSYLKSLLSRDVDMINSTAEKVRACMGKGKDTLFYFWMLLFVDYSYTEDKWVLYEDIQKLFDAGINSPVIYFEICDMFNKQPLMLKRIAPLEIASIRWGMRHSFISQDVIVEYVKLASKMKVFDHRAFKLLENIYEEKQDNSTLNVICSLLISNSKYDGIYHRYYEDAIKRELKFIGLYECYIKSMNKFHYDVIPAEILLYFKYKNTLNDTELAYLYANVIFNKEKHLKIYNDYVPAIEEFMERMIVRGEVSDDLTMIYDEFLDPESVSKVFAPKLINIIFRRKFVCRNKNIVSLIVNHEELENSVTVPVVDGEAYVEILSKSAMITLLDNRGGRYTSTIPYRLERIVDEKSYMDICEKYNSRDYRLLLFKYNNIENFSNKDAREVNLARDIVLCPDISYKIRQKALMHIVEYYTENFDADILMKYMSKVDLEYVTMQEAPALIKSYISLNMFENAFSAIKTFGYVDVEVEALINLVESNIDNKKISEDSLLLSISVYLYQRGYATKNILNYLVVNYNGSLSEMADLFKSVDTSYKNIDLLAENILAQMMFGTAYTEAIYDIFNVYYSGRCRGMVVKAFLKYAAYQYLIKDLKIPSIIMEDLYNEIAKENITDEISKMSLLYYFSTKSGKFTLEQKDFIVKNVKKFISSSQILPFFKEFSSFAIIPADMVFKTYIIFKGESGKQMWVSYSFGQESHSMAGYKSERMTEIIAGIYVKELVVFHGETLIYSIDGDAQGSSAVVESDILKNTTYHKKTSNRFELINSMLVSQETRDDQELIQAMDTYLNNTHFFEENLITL